jgi:hypothetical protein
MLFRMIKLASFVVLATAVLPGCGDGRGGDTDDCEVEEVVESENTLERLDPESPNPPFESGGRACEESPEASEESPEAQPTPPPTETQ